MGTDGSFSSLDFEAKTESAQQSVDKYADSLERLDSRFAETSASADRFDTMGNKLSATNAAYAESLNKTATAEATSASAKATLAAASAKLAEAKATGIKLTEAEATANKVATDALVAEEAIKHQLAMDELLDIQFRIAAEAELAEANAATTMSFAQQKLMMRELTAVGEAATGMHTGLRNVIRMALNPEILALIVVISLVGKAIHAWVQHSEDMNKHLDDNVKWVIKYGQELDKSRVPMENFTEAQRGILSVSHELEAIELAKKNREAGEAITFAKERIEIYNMQLENNKGILGKVIDNTGFWQETIFGTSKKLAEMKEKLKAAEAEQRLFTEAQARGFKTTEEYTASMRHWSEVTDKAYNIVHKLTPAETVMRDELIKLNAEFQQGAIDVFTYNQRLAETAVIANAAAEKLMEKGAKAAESLKDRQIRAASEVEEFVIKSSGKQADKIEADYKKDLAHWDALLKKKEINLGQWAAAVRATEVKKENEEIAELNAEANRDAEAAKKKKDAAQGVANFIRSLEDKTALDSAKAEGDAIQVYMAGLNKETDATLAAYSKQRAAAKGNDAEIARLDAAMEAFLTAQTAKGEHDRGVIRQKETNLELKRIDTLRKAQLKGVEALVNNTALGQTKVGQILQQGLGIFKQLEAMRTAFQAMQEATRLRNSAAGMKAGMTQQASAAGAKATSDASTAATGSYSAMASIPFIGPYLGMIMAALALAYGLKAAADAKSSASSFNAGSSASFDTGATGVAHAGLDRVPRDMTMLLQQDEMVIQREPARVGREVVEMAQRYAEQQAGGQGQTIIQVTMTGPVLAADHTAMQYGRKLGNVIARRTSAGQARG